ncbi:hypothetical protein CR513_57780, partial [Mucuna pruriens]
MANLVLVFVFNGELVQVVDKDASQPIAAPSRGIAVTLPTSEVMVVAPNQRVQPQRWVFSPICLHNYEWLSGEVDVYPSQLCLTEALANLAKAVLIGSLSCERDFVLDPCSIDERVYMRAEEGGVDFFYMYKTQLRDLGVNLPFHKFEANVLRTLSVVPNQLHPNKWVVMQAFRGHFVRFRAIDEVSFTVYRRPIPYIGGASASSTDSLRTTSLGQFQERLGPLRASWPRRTHPGQTWPFPAEPSFKAQVTPGRKSMQSKEWSTCIKGTHELVKVVVEFSKSLVSHTFILSLYSIGGAWCFSNASRRLSKCRSRVWEVGVSLQLTILTFLSTVALTLTLNINFGESKSQEPEPMENNDRTLKELATQYVVYQPWCIQYPQLEPAQSYELKSDLIHLFPKFHGLVGEDPHKHLKEFHVVCSTIRPQEIPEDYIKMMAFPFSLDGAAKD